MTCEFVKDERFKTFDELSSKIQRFKQENSTELSILKSRKLESARNCGKISKNKKVNESLVYYELTYACVHGGTHRARGKGIREAK